MNLPSLSQASGAVILAMLAEFALRLIGAIVLWLIGRRVIKFLIAQSAKALDRRHLDPTIVTYFRSSMSVILTILLVVALLGIFGVQTASFAALLGGAAVAVGVAWSGLLANFAAGVFILFLRPFKVGDYVLAGGVTGTVIEIGLFATTMTTPDNVTAIVGNGKIFADTIQNYTHNDYRRVDMNAQLAHDVNPVEAMALLRQRLAQVPNVLASPAPQVEIFTFNLAGTVLAVRPFCANKDYWQVYFDTNRTINEAFSQAAYPVPDQHYAVVANVSQNARAAGAN